MVKIKLAAAILSCWLGAGTVAWIAEPPEVSKAADKNDNWQALTFQQKEKAIKELIKANLWGVTERKRFAHFGEEESEKLGLAKKYQDYTLVGIVRNQSDLLALLLNPDGKIERVLLGEALPDGQTLATIGGDSINLSGEQQDTELALFPTGKNGKD